MVDDFAKLHAGHMGVHAVLANVLIDKGIVSREELCQRLQQAYHAALQSPGGSQSAAVLAGVLHYLESREAPHSKPR